MTKTVIMLITGVIMTVCNVIIILIYNKQVSEWYEKLDKQHKLKEFEKRRMCNNFCKFKESSKTIEELEWECANCPIAKL